MNIKLIKRKLLKRTVNPVPLPLERLFSLLPDRSLRRRLRRCE
jgi:hypothetical protein